MARPEVQPRLVSIPRQRLEPWLTGFLERHGEAHVTAHGDRVTLVASDGAQADVFVPFPPLAAGNADLAGLVRHVAVDRRVGAVLARKGGYAVGLFVGSRLVRSKVGSAYVQGKTKAGGWSQQRYARRRDNQAKHAYAEAADQVARLLLPEAGTLDAVVTGGDKTAVAAVLADPRLARLEGLVEPRVLPVPDPRLSVLTDFPDAFLALRIRLNELA
jgi:Actinobacteria/chloroflexi VLRF1 release factor